MCFGSAVPAPKTSALLRAKPGLNGCPVLHMLHVCVDQSPDDSPLLASFLKLSCVLESLCSIPITWAKRVSASQQGAA